MIVRTSDPSNQIDNNIPKMSIIAFLQGLEELSIIYRKISLAKHETVKINRRIQSLNRILSKPAYIFIMHFLMQTTFDDKVKIAVLRYIETLMLRRHVCEKRTNENDDIFSKMVPFIAEENILEKIKAFIDDGGFMPDDSEFTEMLPKHQFKGKLIDRAKYVLECVEYHKRGNTDELIVSSNDEVHLEHIIPQTISTKRSKEEFGDWETYLGERSLAKHKKYVNYVRKHDPFGESLNIQAYNNPFTKKKNSYKKSSFLITQELAEQNDFKFSHVDKRGEQLAEVALEIWKI